MKDELDPAVHLRYERLATMLDAAMLRLGTREAGAVQDILNEASDAEPVEDMPSERQLRAGIVLGLFPSPSRPVDPTATGSDWWQRASESLSQRLHDTLLTGVSLEESLQQLTTRVTGTEANGFTDGVMGKARADAQRVLGTQVTNTVSEARMAVGDRNPQRLVAIHQSVLDSRTSLQCIARNGLRYTLPDHEPINHDIPYLSGPPYHPHCRSTMMVVLEDGGAVAQETTAQWLRRQGEAFQDEVLGPTRARMFRAGKLSLTDLIASLSGKPLTLEELGA